MGIVRKTGFCNHYDSKSFYCKPDVGFWLVLIPGIIHINCVHVHEVFDIFLLSLIIYLLIDLLSRSFSDNIYSIPFRPIICY